MTAMLSYFPLTSSPAPGIALSLISFDRRGRNIAAMDNQITQQTRENFAQQFRQWAMERNVSLAQTEQMVMAVLSGHCDTQMLRAAQPSGIHQPPNGFGNAGPAFGFQTPFGIFPLPAMPPMPIPTVPGTYPPPATMVPNMFPTNGMEVNPILPNTQTSTVASSFAPVHPTTKSTHNGLSAAGACTCT